ncbi:MAG: hypothetical protein U0989_02990 [Azonexus sp.]|nr:hypothetical protein [Azonexus sp.]
MSIILALPAQKLVLNAFATFTGTTPSAAAFSQHVSFINTNGEAAYVTFLNSVAKDIPIATLAANLLTNLGLGTVFTQAEAEAYLNSNIANLGGAMTAVATATLNYVSDPAFAKNAEMLAAHTAWVNTATGALNYSSNAANTSSSALTGAVSSGGQTFMLTTSANNFVGTAGNDTFDAGLIDQATPANSTLTAADVLKGGAGTDTLNITGVGTTLDALGGAQVSEIEIINVRATTANTLNAANAAGATTVNANQGAGTFGVTNLATGAAVGVIGNGTVVNGAVSFAYATATDAATINLSGGTKVGTTITNSDAASNVAAATVNSTGAANTIGAIDFDGDTAASLAALTINATTDLTATLTADDFVAAGAALTVTGAGKVNVGALGNFKTVDASTSTGGLTMTLDTVTTSFKGSTGNDTITTATLAAPAAGIIDAGAGTADTLVVAAAADVASAALRGSYTNFEVLNNATAGAIAADGFTGITSVVTSVAGGGFTGLTAAQAAAVNVTVDLGATATTYALKTDTGTADVLGLTFKNATATTVENATNLTVTGFETLNLTASSGSKSLYNAAGTTQLTAGATTLTAGVPDGYDSFAIGAATTDLKTVTLAGDYAAKVDLSANATKVTAVNASANTAGADIVIGGQTGAVVVTGSENRDIITLNAAGAGGLQTVNAGGGNDSIVAAQAQVAVASINGGAGTDTLTINDAGAVAVNDNNFAGVSAIEKLNFSAATGLTFSVGGYANGLATANAGVLDITAGALTAAATIDGTGLSATNALKLTLTNVDALANATATTITLSQGADNIKITQAGAATTDTITITGGVAALASTTAKTIDLSAVTVGGAIAVTTGAGADVIKAAGIAGTYTGGLGADSFTAGAAVDTFAMGTNGSVAGTSMDKIASYGLTADILTFGGATTLLAADATATVAGVNVAQSAGGLVSFAAADNTLALKIAAIQADAQLDAAGSVAVFNDGGNAYVYYAGAAIGNTDDQIIELTGVTAASIAAGATTIVS